MVRGRLIWRIVRLIVISCCVLLVATFVTVQVGQRILRHRAERLIPDVQRLEVGKSSWADLQGIMARWGKYGHYDGTCNNRECHYEINLTDTLGAIAFDIQKMPSGLRYSAFPLALAVWYVHWNAVDIEATIDLEGDRVSGWRLLWVSAVPEGIGSEARHYRDGPYELLVSATAVQRASPYLQEWPMPDWHPGYSVREPSGCTNCISIRSEFDPTSSIHIRRSLSNFNLDCVTRWKPCTVESDIAPGAWNTLQEEYDRRHIYLKTIESCTYPIEQMALASDAIVLVQLNEAFSLKQALDHSVKLSAKLLQSIKGPPPAKYGANISWSSDWLNLNGKFPTEKGAKLIVMASVDESGASSENAEVHPYMCGVIAASPENIAKVHAELQPH